MISDSSDEDEDPILMRDLRIKRAMDDKLVVRTYSYNEKEYAADLNILRCYDDALSDDVMREEPHTWSLSFYRLGSCLEDVDNNATKSFNSTIIKARAKALVPMLETIRRQEMTRIVKRNKKSLKHQGRFLKYVMKIVASEKIVVDKCTVYCCTHGIFEVGNYWMDSTNRLVIAPPPPPLPSRRKGSKRKREKFARIKAGHKALGCKNFPKEKVPRKRKAKNAGIYEDKKEIKTKKKKKSEKEKKTQGQETISITQPSAATQE
ncbi:putative protein [Arabidopsis thaliana]|uniref:Uncharacterized protein T15B3_140 n=1 Tax=Arabidopsis thaliana TaxID=3702 RepID=Q9LXW0_ARATH|nr:putative protein [Arabidopsis thaliana]